MNVLKTFLPLMSVVAGIVAASYMDSTAMFAGLLVWKFAGMVGAISIGVTSFLGQVDAMRRERKADTSILLNEAIDKKQDAQLGVMLRHQAPNVIDETALPVAERDIVEAVKKDATQRDIARFTK